MGSLEAEEALLKKKLEATDNLEERREIRKQLRELRNRKFEEEVKKITAGDYRPGKDRSTITNGGETSLGSIGRSRSIKDDDGEDSYGLSNIDNEEDLQAMLNDTPFTETDKRKKIRGRIREIRNQKLGIGEPVVLKRHQRDVTASVKDTQKETIEKQSSVDQHAEKVTEEPRSSYRSSYRSKYRIEDDSKIESKVPEISTSNVGMSRGQRQEESNGIQGRVNGYSDTDESDQQVGNEDRKKRESKDDDEDAAVTEETGKEDADNNDDDEEEESLIDENDARNEEEDAVDEEQEEEKISINDEEDREDLGKEEFLEKEKSCNAENEDEIAARMSDDEADYSEDEKARDEERMEDVYKEEEYDDDAEDQRYSDEDEVNEDIQIEGDGDDELKNKEKLEEEEFSDESYDDEEDMKDKKESSSSEEEAREERDNFISVDSGKHSVPLRDPSQDEKDEDQEAVGEEEVEEEEEDDDDGDRVETEDEYSRSEDEEDYEADKPVVKKNQPKYSDESYSDYTPTDDGSSVSGKRFEDDQNLDDFSLKSPSSSLSRRQGSSFASKIDKVFQEKEPGIQEGKDFKEKLRKTCNSLQTGNKKNVEQVDFRTVLRSAEKPKRFGEKPSHGPEQVDFRNLLQTKVKTKSLADKALTAEQVDFRTVLKAGAVEKPKPVQRKTSATAEQVDFRTVLKKEPSVKSRKVSTDDKEIFRKIRAGSDLVANANATAVERKLSETRSGRPSIEALKRSGSIDKAKDELDKHRTPSSISENEITTRKAGRPSLDALKESGELGRTRDKSAKFQKNEEKVFKKPAVPPPKPKKVIEEKNEMLLVEEENQEPEVEQVQEATELKPALKDDSVSISKDTNEKEMRSSRRQRRSVKENEEVKTESEQPNEKQKEDEIENRTRSRRSRDRDEKTRSRRAIQSDESSEKPRSRRVVRGEDSSTEATSDSTKVTNDTEVTKDVGTAKRSEGTEDKRASLKSEDKRARNRRLRRDQNEVVREVEAKKAVSPERVDDHDGKNEENVISVKSSSLERVSVRVKLSSSKQPDVDRKAKEEHEGSDEEEIGTRRNRRRLLRKGSVEDQQIAKVSVKTEKIKDPKNETETATTSSITTNDADNTDAKPSRGSTRKHVEIASKSSLTKSEDKSTEKKSPSDAAKSRQAKMADLDAKLAERRRQRAMENRKKQQQTKSSRMAFKEKLESGAPTTEGSSSPALQRANSNMTKLLHWCQKMTDGYPGVEVTNFNKSWSDGLAFCALLHNFIPEKIPFNELSPKRPRENFEIAFSAALEEGVADLLEVDDMVNMEIPDTKSVITYLHAIYQNFVVDRR